MFPFRPGPNQRTRRGAANYTVETPEGAKIEVQMAVHAYFVKKALHGEPIKRTIGWGAYPDLDAAWQEAVRRSLP